MDIKAIQKLRFDPITHMYDQRDTMLYALGLGLGDDPMSRDQLRFVYEAGLLAMPSMVNILAHPGFWARRPEFGIDWVRLLHAEQEFVMHDNLPASGGMRGESRVSGIEDKGEGRGALLHQETELHDLDSGTHVATVRQTLFLLGDGGKGGFGEVQTVAAALPCRTPDRLVEIATLERQALIYRLSGDWNPLHADPEAARRAGFPRPILHGLCTNGIACRAVLSTYAESDASRLHRMFTRFTKPVFPGDTIRLEFFEDGPEVRFRAIALERNQVVLDRCSAAFQ